MLHSSVSVLELTTLLVIDLQKNAKVVSIDGYEDVPEYDEKALQKAVASQPISVAIEAGGRDFQLYQSVSSSVCTSMTFVPRDLDITLKSPLPLQFIFHWLQDCLIRPHATTL